MDTHETKSYWALTDFDVGRELGQGAFGNVYIAREKVSRYVVALKVLAKSQIIDTGNMKHVEREVRIQYHLEHPNILEMYGYFNNEDNIYLILEHAKHGALNELLRKYIRFNEKTAAYYIRDVTRALKYLHSKKVIHRDIKPENILIGHNGQLKIADFGLSVKSSSSKRKTVCGTLEYLAPEMVKEDPHSFKVDIWSLGVLCYELLVGITPFSAKHRNTTYLKIQHGIIKYPVFVSERAKDLMGKVLVVNPEHRLPLATVLQHQWILENAPAKALPPAFYPDHDTKVAENKQGSTAE